MKAKLKSTAKIGKLKLSLLEYDHLLEYERQLGITLQEQEGEFIISYGEFSVTFDALEDYDEIDQMIDLCIGLGIFKKEDIKKHRNSFNFVEQNRKLRLFIEEKEDLEYADSIKTRKA